MEVRQTAGPSPQRIAAAMRAGGKQIPGAIRRGFQRGLKPLEAEVKRQATAKFPSGYAPVFVASAQTRVSVRGAGALVTAEARIYATGQRDRRKVTDLNAGVLRHPVWGRQRRRKWTASRPRKRIPGGQLIRNPWATQSIPAGFADEAFEATRPAVTAAMGAVLDEIEQTLTGA